MDSLLCIAQRWLQPNQLTPVEIVEHITLNRFLQAFHGEERRAIGMKAAQIPRDMVSVLECVLATLSMGRVEKKIQFHHEPH